MSNGERQQPIYQLTIIDTNNRAAKIDNECRRAAEKSSIQIQHGDANTAGSAKVLH